MATSSPLEIGHVTPRGYTVTEIDTTSTWRRYVARCPKGHTTKQLSGSILKNDMVQCAKCRTIEARQETQCAFCGRAFQSSFARGRWATTCSDECQTGIKEEQRIATHRGALVKQVSRKVDALEPAARQWVLREFGIRAKASIRNGVGYQFDAVEVMDHLIQEVRNPQGEFLNPPAPVDPALLQPWTSFPQYISPRDLS